MGRKTAQSVAVQDLTAFVSKPTLSQKDAKMKYVLQLVPGTYQAWTHGVTWPGYWTGLGYVESPKKALPFFRKKDALQAMSGHPLGMNGCMQVVSLTNG